MQDTPNQLGGFIRQQRLKLGLALNELARRAHIDPGALSRLERGKIEVPAPHRLQALARELDIEYEDLAALAGYLPTTSLPGLPVYLRKKYDDLSPDEIRQVDTYVEFLRQQHDDQTDSLKGE